MTHKNNRKNIENQDPFDFDISKTQLFNIFSFIKFSPSHFKKSFITKLCSYCFVIFFLIFNFLLVLGQIISCKNIHDLPSLSAHLSELCFNAVALYKWFHCLLSLNGLKRVIKLLQVCYKSSFKIYINYKDNKVNECIKDSEIFFIFWQLIVVGGSVHWCLGPFIGDIYKNLNINDNNNKNISLSRSYPSVMVAPFEITNNWRYIALYLFETFGVLSSGIGLSCCDILFVTILIHIRGHLSYLNECILNEDDIESILKSNNPSEKFKEKLINCIIYHTKILKLHEAYEDYSNGAMFAQCIENIVALCVVSLQVSILPFTTNLDSMLELSSIIEYTIGIALELFVYCYLGTQIEELGLEVGNSLFSSNWEQFIDDKKQNFEIYKILTFAIMRTQEPILITGGPFYIMNLATFKNLVYLSISNSVVLRQLQIGN